MTVVVDNATVVFDVDPDCTIMLHDDRVKLRLLQPMDYARVVYSEAPEAPVAHAIRVNWWLGEAPAGLANKTFRPAGSVRSVG